MFGLEFNVLPIIILVALLVFVSKAWLTVPQGFQYTLERFGRFKKTLEPGFHLITPFFEGVGRRMNMMEQCSTCRARSDHQGQRHGRRRRRGVLPVQDAARRPTRSTIYASRP